MDVLFNIFIRLHNENVEQDVQEKALPVEFCANEPMVGQEKNLEGLLDQFIEKPIIRPDGAFEPMQYRTAGHLISNGIHPENLQAGSLLQVVMLSARLGNPISAMLVTEAPHEAIHLLGNCQKMIPKEAIVECQEVKPEYLYAERGSLVNRKCIISSKPDGFRKVRQDLESILTRGHSTRQELRRSGYDISLSEYQSELQLAFVGIEDPKAGSEITHPAVLKIPMVPKRGSILSDPRDCNAQRELIQSPLFKIRKSLQRLKHRPVIIPFVEQIERVMAESGCDHVYEKIDILKKVIAICTIINRPPSLRLSELASMIYGTDEMETQNWLVDAGHYESSALPDETIVATKVDYHMAHVLLDGILLSGGARLTDRQIRVFETVRTINMGKMSEAILHKNTEVEKLSTIAQSSNYWVTREKIFEFINGSHCEFSLSSVSNDLIELVKMGLVERAKPPRKHHFGYYITTMSLNGPIKLPAPETIQEPVYEGKEVMVVHPISGLIEKI